MGKATLAMGLADKLGTSFDEAARLVDDLGDDGARQVLRSSDDTARLGDDSASAGSRLDGISNRALAAGVGSAGVGGGALYWKRQQRLQDEAQAAAEAEKSEAMDETIQSILESEDLPADVAAELAESAAFGIQGDTPSGGDGFDPGDLVPDMPDLGISDSVQFAVLVIVVLGALWLYLSDDSPDLSMALPSTDTPSKATSSTSGGSS
jgi:hypothetical protein